MSADQYSNSQKLILWIAYILQILVLPAVFGAAINALKLRQYRRSPVVEDAEHQGESVLFVSHHQWLLRTFLVFMFLIAVAVGTLYYGVGYVVGFGAILWWLYRMARGIIGYAENKPMPV